VGGILVGAAGDLPEGQFGAEYVVTSSTARILAVVGALRALGHLGPPLLDGIGRPGLSLRYQLVAAVTLSTLFLVAAQLGTSFMAIAIAWAVGYPLAFAVLWATVLAALGVGLIEYVRQVARIPALIALAVAVAACVHPLLGAVGPGVRLAVTAVTVLGVGFGLLAWLEGLTPRAVARALRR